MTNDTRTALSPAKFCQQQAAPTILDDDVADLNDPTQHDVLWDAPMTPAEAQALEKTFTVPMDGGHATIDNYGNRVELTIRLGGRTVVSLHLSHREAEGIGYCLARPDGVTVTDIFSVADCLGLDASTMLANERPDHA